MPAKMVINTESTMGYNKLKQPVLGMQLGVNNEVNPDTKKVGITLTEGGPSKIKRQISPKPVYQKPPSNTEPVHQKRPSNTEPVQENNKIWLIAGLALAVFAFSHAVLKCSQ